MTTVRSSGVQRFGQLVDSTGKALVRNVQESRSQEATELGSSANIVTSEIALSSTSESGIFYFKNNSNVPYILDSFIFVSEAVTSGTTVNAGSNRAIVYKNPTGFSTTTACDIIQNRNTSFPNSLRSSLAYEGAEGATITGGERWARFFFNDSARVLGVLDFIIAPGDSVAVSIQPKVTAGSQNFYVVMVGHFETVAFT